VVGSHLLLAYSNHCKADYRGGEVVVEGFARLLSILPGEMVSLAPAYLVVFSPPLASVIFQIRSTQVES
jgi:hypothetical protein